MNHSFAVLLVIESAEAGQKSQEESQDRVWSNSGGRNWVYRWHGRDGNLRTDIRLARLERLAAQDDLESWPSNPRNRERRARAEYKPGTWACRNCGNSRLRPHQYGRHTSWNSPSEQPAAHLATDHRNFRWQGFQVLCQCHWRDSAGGESLDGAVRAAGSFTGSGLRDGALWRRGQFVVFVQARLNFVNDAEIADKLGAVRINEMRLAVRIAINGGRRKVRELRLAQREAGRCEKNQQRGGDRDGAVSESGRRQPR